MGVTRKKRSALGRDSRCEGKGREGGVTERRRVLDVNNVWM